MAGEELQQSCKQLQVLQQELHSAGAWVCCGRRHEPATATVLRRCGGEVVASGGPFADFADAPRA